MCWLLAASAVVVPVVVVALRRIVHGRGAGSRAERLTGSGLHEPEVVPNTTRFNAHLLFAEGAASQIIIDGLAEAVDPEGVVIGIPFP
jgi:hypothetical protein